MKKLICIVLVITALLVFAQPAFAGKPYGSPPVSYDLATLPSYNEFPELGVVVCDLSAVGTYTPHIVNPANDAPYAEESWIEFNGGGSGNIVSPFFIGSFYVPPGTAMEVHVHIQNHITMLTLESSAPVSLTFYFWGSPTTITFTSASIKLISGKPPIFTYN